MTLETLTLTPNPKPKPKQIPSQSQARTTILSQPWTNGIHEVIYLFSQINEEQK